MTTDDKSIDTFSLNYSSLSWKCDKASMKFGQKNLETTI